MRELRRRRRIHRHAADGALADSAKDLFQSFKVQRLRKHVLHHLTNQRVVRNANVSFDIVLAGRSVGEDRRQEIVRAHALDLKWNLLSVAKACQRQGPRCIPAPARSEDRRSQRGLFQDAPNRLRSQEVEDVGERETVLLAKRDVQAVFGRSGLQFKVEGTAEPLAERKPPGSVDSSPKGRVNHELHAAGLVEKALGYNCMLGRDHAQNRAPSENVFHRLLGGGLIQSALFFQPGNSRLELQYRRRAGYLA